VPLRVAGAFVVDHGGRIFFQMRSAERKLFPNTWDIVGGHLEPGETPVEAMRREVLEETGWRVSAVLSEFAEYGYTGDDGVDRRETDFIVRVDGDLERPRLEEGKHTTFRWLAEDELDVLDANTPVDGGMLKRVAERAFVTLRAIGV
jgi:8-oxo-dGTP pyrophosphatase MutT (NUDIX family)